MVKFKIDILKKEEVVSAMDMLYGLCKDKYCYRDEFDSLKQTVEALQQENAALQCEIKKSKEEITCIQDEKKNLQIVNKELMEENNRLKEEKQKIVQESKLYKDRLSELGIDNGDSFNNKVYFQVAGKSLEQTTDNKAPYIVVNNSEFSFNDDGQHLKAIQDKEKTLCPFCDIISSVPDANYVNMLAKGKCKTSESSAWLMEIVEKAKIKLIRR